LIFINQIRNKIGGMPFANKETTTGGNALKFYASLRIEVRKIASLKKNELHFGNRIAVKMVKNKVAPPFKKVEIDLLFDEGISKELDLLDASIHYQVIEKAGAWFAFEGDRFAQGRDQALQCLKSNKELAARVLDKVYLARKQIVEKQ
jgi:recombination protein RecA